MASIRDKFRKIKIAPDISFDRKGWIDEVEKIGWVWSDENSDWSITVAGVQYWGSEISKNEWTDLGKRKIQENNLINGIATGFGPRGGNDSIYIGNDIIPIPTDNPNDTILERKNGFFDVTNSLRINPYEIPYTGKTVNERIQYLKKVLSWYEVEINSLKRTIQYDIDKAKRHEDFYKAGQRELKIIEVAGLLIGGATQATLLIGIMGAISKLGSKANNSSSIFLKIVAQIEKNTQLLQKYQSDYSGYKNEYDELTANSDSGEGSNNLWYWIGGIVVLAILIYLYFKYKN